MYRFPDDFIFGAATASYQIEGAYNEDGKSESIWDRFTHTGKSFNKETGDIACDHYHRIDEDVEMMAGLGLEAYRFSIAWPRIMPDGKGPVNKKGLDFYDRLIDKLLKKNIKPFVTLYHWDLPQKLEDKGGWRAKDTCYYFADYARETVKHFSDRVSNWITFNETWCSSVLGYETGEHAPGVKESPKTVNQVIHNLYLAHGLGVRTVRECGKKGSEVGLALCYPGNAVIPITETPENLNAADKAFMDHNKWWLDPLYKGEYPKDQWEFKGKDVPEITADEMKIISSPTDFLGVNIYHATLIEADNNPGSPGYKLIQRPDNSEKTTMNWPIDARSIYYLLKFTQKNYPAKKFYVTENGASFNDEISPDGKVHDPKRISFLHDYILSCKRTIDDGINLKGYFLWSLMDNFEWQHATSKRFGITYIDYKNNCKRILKDSALWYKETIQARGVK